jgi:hypothetical protein
VFASAGTGIFYTIGSIITVLIWIWGWRVGARKDRPFVGFILAFFFSLIGILIIYLIPRKRTANRM